MCGKALLVDSDVRYVVSIEVFAAYDPMEITADDLKEDRLDEIRELVERMRQADAQKLEDQVYKHFRFDLCPSCRKKYLTNPLPGRPSA
jgi:hypothetical protein